MTRLFFSCAVIIGLLPVAAAQGLLPAPAKVVRYADIIIQRYDQNGDKVLQKEEWEKMPGVPQAIDLDGDGQITRDELIWYFRHYGQSRTVHRTIAVDLSEPFRFDPANLRLFRPAWQRSSPPPDIQEEAVQETTDDVTEAMMNENEQEIDDEVYQKLLEEKRIPSSRPYHVLPEHLHGVPRWFILADKNGDGQVSLAEFAPTLSPRSVALFQSLDKNGNNFIEPDEAR